MALSRVVQMLLLGLCLDVPVQNGVQVGTLDLQAGLSLA